MEILVPHVDAIRLLVQCDNPPEEPDADSEAFHHWKQRAAINLATIFGDGSQHVKAFNAISFRTRMVYRAGGGGHKALSAEERQSQLHAYRRGVQQLRALIGGLRERIQIRQQQRAQLEAKELRQQVQATDQSEPLSERVFIVHGHDGGLKNAVARVVTEMGLEPCILQERPNKGRTVIEKFEAEAQPSGFAIVLFTSDDLAESQKALANSGETVPKEKLRDRARQNVVFELGYFVGHLGRGRVAVISDGGLEWPSDLAGVVYIGRDGWAGQLVRELRECYEATQDQINRAIAVVE